MTECKRGQKETKAPDPMRNKIKTTFCATCLSRERKLFPIEGLNFDEFCADIPLSEDEDLVCWECKAIAVKMNEFRYKACKAQAIIENMIRRKKCDMFIHSLSNLKAVNRSENIIIGYEVDSDTNAQTTDVQVSMDFPKQEVDGTDYHNTLSPDVDFTDPLDPSDGVHIEQTAKINKGKQKIDLNTEEHTRNIVLNDSSNRKRSVTQDRGSQSESNDDDSETDSPLCRLRKRKHRDDDDDHLDVSDGPSSPVQPDTDQAMNLSSILQSTSTRDTSLINKTGSMFEMLRRLEARVQQIAQDELKGSKRFKTNVRLISNVVEFDNFERNLKKPEFEAKKRRYLLIFCNKGIGNGRNNGYTIVDKIFTREFLTKCSWSGGSRSEPKICFKGYKRFTEFFFNVLHDCDPTVTVEDCEEFLKLVLKNSVKRSQSNMRKSSARYRRNKKEVLYGQNLELLLEQAEQAGECVIDGTGEEEQSGRSRRASVH